MPLCHSRVSVKTAVRGVVDRNIHTQSCYHLKSSQHQMLIDKGKPNENLKHFLPVDFVQIGLVRL